LPWLRRGSFSPFHPLSLSSCHHLVLLYHLHAKQQHQRRFPLPFFVPPLFTLTTFTPYLYFTHSQFFIPFTTYDDIYFIPILYYTHTSSFMYTAYDDLYFIHILYQYDGIYFIPILYYTHTSSFMYTTYDDLHFIHILYHFTHTFDDVILDSLPYLYSLDILLTF
jgi:hypothetical protein